MSTSYVNEGGSEKNLEKTFYRYQKAAENGNEMVMNNLVNDLNCDDVTLIEDMENLDLEWPCKLMKRLNFFIFFIYSLL